MSKYECEVYGLVNYGPDLSYHELYELEEQLMCELQGVFDGLEAAHVNFWGAGDMLQFQCAFSELEALKVRDLCDEIIPLLRNDLTGRVLCMDKHLTAVHVFHLNPGGWKERSMDITSLNNCD